MLRTPGFQQDRIDLYKNQIIQAMERRNDQTEEIQSREWARLMRGDNHFSTASGYEVFRRFNYSSGPAGFPQAVLPSGELSICSLRRFQQSGNDREIGKDAERLARFKNPSASRSKTVLRPPAGSLHGE